MKEPGRAREVRILPDDLANQIAAGEVVERPASVAKELLENAVDAGARRVRVDCDGGGIALIRVSDDGSGMKRGDAELSVLRHATSKLRVLDDLRAIESFGFRGEALPSIASVSRFLLRTRTSDDLEGTEVQVDGGGQAVLRPSGGAVGTTVEVADLFFNVPVRRKFLKSLATESAHVTEVVEAVALANPSVAFVLAREGRVVREILRAESREERARAVFEGESLAPCRGRRGPLEIEAFLSRPERARQGAGGLNIFVNGRSVKDRVLARAMAHAYGSVLEPGRYPVGVAYLDLPYELVDVNVHPQKAEVRFADGKAAADALYHVLRDALAQSFGLPQGGGSRWGERKPKLVPDAPQAVLPAWSWTGVGLTSTGATIDAARTDERSASRPAPADGGTLTASASEGLPSRHSSQTGAALDAATGTEAPQAPPSVAGASKSPPLPSAGTVSSRGSLVSVASLAPQAEGAGARPLAGPEALAAVANAAWLSVAEPSGEGRPAVSLDPVNLGSGARSDRAAGEGTGSVFGALRFLVQVRSTYLICEGEDGLYVLDQHAAAERVTFDRLRRSYLSRSVVTQRLLFPALVDVSVAEVELLTEAQAMLEAAGMDVRAAGPTTVAVHAVPILLKSAPPERLLLDLLGELARTGPRAFSGAIDLALATMACHGSLRAGDPVSSEEAKALLEGLDGIAFAGHCPHGRPIVTRLGWGELETRVGRR